MISLELWRSRVGHFHCALSGLRKVKTCRQRAGHVNFVGVGPTQVVTAYLCCFLFVIVVHSFSTVCSSGFHMPANAALFSPFKTENVSYGGCQTFGTMTLTNALKWNVQSESEGVFVSVGLLPVVALSTCAVANALSILRRLLLSGDIESNPGPNTSDKDVTHTEPTSSQPPQTDGTIAPDIAKQILQAIKEQGNQMAMLGSEIRAIRAELKDVDLKCGQINERCNRLEQDKKELVTTVSGIASDVGRLREETDNSKKETERLCQTTTSLNEEIQKMNEEIDRLESFSRRDNLRMFGIPQTTPNEDYRACASAVVQVLNSGAGNKTWTEQDIIRAHRIGKGTPKPMIVKFRNWNDKMDLLLNKELRARLETSGVRVANDLTKRQAAVVAEARREGKSAYFVRGTLTVGPRRSQPSPRTYAEAASAVTETDDREETHRDRGADRQCQQDGRGDSPRHVIASGSPRTCSEGQPLSSTHQASSVSSRGGGRGGGSGAGRGGPARADRGKQQSSMGRYMSPGSGRPRSADSDTRVLRSGSVSR